MANDDHLVQPGAFDIAGKRLDIVGDSHLPQVAGLVPPSRHVEDKHGQVRCQPMDLSTTRPHESAAIPPPCTRTNAGSPMAGSFGAVPPRPHRKGRDARARHDAPVTLISRVCARLPAYAIGLIHSRAFTAAIDGGNRRHVVTSRSASFSYFSRHSSAE